MSLHLDEAQHAVAGPGIKLDLVFLTHQTHLVAVNLDPRIGWNLLSEVVNWLTCQKIHYITIGPRPHVFIFKKTIITYRSKNIKSLCDQTLQTWQWVHLIMGHTSK